MKALYQERCDLCTTPYEGDPDDPRRYRDGCVPCLRAEAAFERRFRIGGDIDYVCHELAHFVLRYGKIPRYRRDWSMMERDLNEQTVGRAQIHELRVLALQGLAYIQLGWNLSWKRLVGLSWFGLEEAAARTGPVSYLCGTPVVTTERAARRHVRNYRGQISRKKVDLLTGAIASFHRAKEG